MLRLTKDTTRQILTDIESTIQLDLYFYIMEIVQDSPTKNITISLDDFQVTTSRKSKGVIHFVDAIEKLNYSMCLFQSFERIGNNIKITHTNYEPLDVTKGYTAYDCDEIYNLNKINEKKIYIYMKALQYKGEYNLKLEYFSKMGIGCNIYQLKNIISNLDIINAVTKISDTDLNVKFNAVVKQFVKPESKNNGCCNKIDYSKNGSQKYNFVPQEVKPEIKSEIKFDLPLDAIEIQNEIKMVLGSVYTDNIFRFEDTIFYKKNECIFVMCKGFMIQWYKDNHFDKRIPNMFNRLNPDILHNIVFIEKDITQQSNN